MNPQWTVVTVAYNSATMLAQCWSQARRPFEWVVVDNASTDDSAAVARRLGARVVHLPQNVGFARANNVGVRCTTNPYLLFANPDLVVAADGLDGLREHLDVHSGLVAPQLLNSDGSAQPNGRGLPYVTAKLGNRRLWPFHRLHDSYRVLAEPGEARYAAWTIGAAVAVRRGDLARIGGWDERYFVYYEDAELGLRAWRHGLPVAVLGDVRWVHHWARATNAVKWSPAHNLELHGARLFYRSHPEFVLGVPPPARRHPLASRLSGRTVTGANLTASS